MPPKAKKPAARAVRKAAGKALALEISEKNTRHEKNLAIRDAKRKVKELAKKKGKTAADRALRAGISDVLAGKVRIPAGRPSKKAAAVAVIIAPRRPLPPVPKRAAVIAVPIVVHKKAAAARRPPPPVPPRGPPTPRPKPPPRLNIPKASMVDLNAAAAAVVEDQLADDLRIGLLPVPDGEASGEVSSDSIDDGDVVAHINRISASRTSQAGLYD